eukprot:TRINITY_DN18847_c0_g1_i1.p1 TRINITY_DN18847_c0_g1~~TRINITY_DN18847_c0_g1_i1.p1  ORF type:complete len:353 (-),score=-0.07 TRINITY_DN18847_c0_g1_i1:593-1651(-)
MGFEKKMPSRRHTKLANISYFRGSEQDDHVLDIYTPRLNDCSPRKARPCVLFVHSGAWRLANKEDTLFWGHAHVGRTLAENGIVCAVMSYRQGCGNAGRALLGSVLVALLLDLAFYAIYSQYFQSIETQEIVAFVLVFCILLFVGILGFAWVDTATTGTHPSHMVDLAHALRWMMQYSRSFGADGTKMYLCGHGVGALMVTLLTHHESLLTEVGLDRDKLEACIKGVIGIGGPYDLQALCTGETLLGFIRRHYYGLHCSDFSDEQLHDASPIMHLKETCIPYLLLNGDCCQLPLVEQAKMLQIAMQRLQIRVDMRVLPSIDNWSLVRNIGRPCDTITKILLDFIISEAKPAA